MFSLGAANRYVSSKGGSPGDSLIITKGAAIAATGILAKVFHNYVEKNTDPETADAALGEPVHHRGQGVGDVRNSRRAVEVGRSPQLG